MLPSGQLTDFSRLYVKIFQNSDLENRRRFKRDSSAGLIFSYGVAAPVAAPVVGVPRRPNADPAPYCPADFNGDGKVDGSDLGRLLGVWGLQDDWYDLSWDSTVNGTDLGMLLAFWGDC